MIPPLPVNFTALDRRLSSTFSICSGSALSVRLGSPLRKTSAIRLRSASGVKAWVTDRTKPTSSTGCMWAVTLPACRRVRSRIWLISRSRRCVLRSIRSPCSRASRLSAPKRPSSRLLSGPSINVSGVRNSWLRLAKSRDRSWFNCASLTFCAASCCSFRCNSAVRISIRPVSSTARWRRLRTRH